MSKGVKTPALRAILLLPLHWGTNVGLFLAQGIHATDSTYFYTQFLQWTSSKYPSISKTKTTVTSKIMVYIYSLCQYQADHSFGMKF